jgi:hypothetical protein
MQPIRRAGPWILGLYALYLIKSVMGINILPNVSAPSIFKLPIAPIMQARYGSDWH